MTNKLYLIAFVIVFLLLLFVYLIGAEADGARPRYTLNAGNPFLIDWQNESYGAIFETDSGACFWWMYQAEWGEDNNPHIAEHYWIECP